MDKSSLQSAPLGAYGNPQSSFTAKTWRHLGRIICLSWCIHAPAAELDSFRLVPQIRPVTESVQLELDPAADQYHGHVRIEINFGLSTNRFRFHAKALELGRATLDGQEVSLKIGEASLVTATAADLIPVGKHVLEVDFSKTYSRDGTGLYKVVTGGQPYLFTQMEAEYARQAFPCWDEPGFKIPWLITVAIPSAMEAVGNMPIARSTVAGTTKRVEFGRTPPMPSYLVEVAVGSFEFLNISDQFVPGRIVTVQGKSALGELAAKEAPALLAGLEDYFGLPYPFPKLDHIAVPEFVFGAMENVGAITYKDSILLVDPDRASFQNRRSIIGIMTHEMAHMWFGDLVTMEWWDDVWLNESFATWMSSKIAGRVHPDARFSLISFYDVLRARAADSQPSVRAIRRSFSGRDNILEAVDVLSYQKGQSILRMAEGWLGEERFRQGLRQYFKRHQWANARAEDLWDALAGTGEASIAEVMRRYIEQPGMPALTFTRLPGDRCRIRQQRYRTIIGKNAADETWHVPVALRYGARGGVKEFRCLLTTDVAEFNVPGLSEATWVYPNAGEFGYYTWSLGPDLSDALTNRASFPLTEIERLGLLNATHLAIEAGSFPADQALDLIPSFAADPVPEIKEQVIQAVDGVYRTYADAADHAAFAAFIRRTLRPMLDAIGFAPKPNESQEVGPLRNGLLRVLGCDGENSDVVTFCREQAFRLVDNPRSVDPAIVPAILLVTSWHGDAAWSDQVRVAYEHATAPALRRQFLTAITPFRDPSLARSGLEYLLTEAVRPTDIRACISAAAQQPGLARLSFEWVKERYDRLKQRLPEDQLPFLTTVLAQGDSGLLEEGRAFFLDSARKTPLTELEFQKMAEAVALRTALRERYQAAVVRRVTELQTGKATVQTVTPPASEHPTFYDGQVARVPKPDIADVSSISNIIRVSYEVINGPAGSARQWNRDKTLYMPGTTFVSVTETNGQVRYSIMTPEEYRHTYDTESASYESEIGRSIERFGNVAQVRSVSAVRSTPDGTVEERYVNYYQLFWDGRRWWIAGIVWDKERTNAPIPEAWIGCFEDNSR